MSTYVVPTDPRGFPSMLTLPPQKNLFKRESIEEMVLEGVLKKE
jgi:hypothetical protein